MRPAVSPDRSTLRASRDDEQQRSLWIEWMALEDEFFGRDGAGARADYLVSGQPSRPIRLGGRGRHSRRGVVMILVPGLDRAPTRAPACDLRHLSSCMMGRSAWGWPTQAATEPDMAPAHRSVLVPGGVPDVLLDSAGPVPAVWAAGRPHDPRSLRAPAAPLAAASRAGSRSATNTLCSMCQSCG